MRLTSFTDLGLRALMRMAGVPERAFTTSELASEFRISRNHLAKIMQRLAQGGIVTTQRGGNGGVTLARPPRQIGLGEVVRLLEAERAMVECLRPGGGGCGLDGRCRLKMRHVAAEAAFLAELDRSTLDDIALSPGTPVTALPAY